MKNEKIDEERIKSEYADYEQYMDSLSLKDAELENKIKEVNDLIEHVNNRIIYTETRITRTVTFALSLVAIGMALFAAVIRLDGISLYFGLATSILFISTGSITSFTHVLQINPKYPFRALPNDWKWFYSRSVDDNYKPPFYVKETEQNYFKKRYSHINGLKNYAEKIVKETPSVRLKIDIQQLYLLHVNEKYKNSFLTSLRKVLTIGLIATLLVMISFFGWLSYEKIYSNIYNGCEHNPEQSE